jgi:hypothetical protein
MYIDYIKVMEWNGQGEVQLGPPPAQEGTFGIFTDETPTDNSLFTNEPAHIYVWEGTLSDGNIPAYEGDNGISWVTNGLGWFGAGIMSVQPINLLNFADGHLNFMIKIPANIGFQIGVIDSWGNQNYVEFPANQTAYGLVRNGEWAQASIPVSDLRGPYIDLRMLTYEFVILEVNGANCEFALDDIYYSGGVVSIDEPITNSNTDFIAIQPNPFNSNTTILYELSNNEYVQIEVYDISGRLIKKLVEEYQQQGTHQIQWNAREQKAGIYLIKIKSGNNTAVLKCLLKK